MKKGDEVHFIFNGLMPALRTGTIAAVYRDGYRVDDLGKIPEKFVFPKTAKGLKDAQAMYRERLLEMRAYNDKQNAEIDKELRELR